jgi:hypothetical protein
LVAVIVHRERCLPATSSPRDLLLRLHPKSSPCARLVAARSEGCGRRWRSR